MLYNTQWTHIRLEKALSHTIAEYIFLAPALNMLHNIIAWNLLFSHSDFFMVFSLNNPFVFIVRQRSIYFRFVPFMVVVVLVYWLRKSKIAWMPETENFHRFAHVHARIEAPLRNEIIQRLDVMLTIFALVLCIISHQTACLVSDAPAVT